MKRPLKFDEKGTAFGGAVLPFPHAVRRDGQTAQSTVIGNAAGTGPFSAPSAPFISLGDAVDAVVLHLRGGYPKIRVSGQLGGGSRPLKDQQEGEDR